MKITIIAVGRTDRGYLSDGVDGYLKRIARYNPVEFKTIPYLKNTKNLSPDQQKTKEGEAILGALPPQCEVITLDEKGRELSSVEYAQWIESKFVSGPKELVFVIGGAYGISDGVKSRSAGSISLSRLTFSHQLVRLVFVEQLYRAFTIIRGEPYHHE